MATWAMLSPEPKVPWTNTMGRKDVSQSLSETTTSQPWSPRSSMSVPFLSSSPLQAETASNAAAQHQRLKLGACEGNSEARTEAREQGMILCMKARGVEERGGAGPARKLSIRLRADY